MEKKTVFSAFLSWLGSSEMFARPVKRLPGKWLLFEYYIDSRDGLLNFKEDMLKEHNQQLEIHLDETNKLVVQSNLPVSLFQEITKGEWGVVKNFITFIHPDDYRKNVEFQFAFEKNNLKLLKKDGFGKIEFFGFFKKVQAGD